MRKQVYPIAVHLSQATRIALAPAFLACLYRDLRLLKEQLFDVSSKAEDCNTNELSATVWGPFQIMQLWAWERFPRLQPTPDFLSPGKPRAARWHQLKSNSKYDFVRTILNLCVDFQWRPYSFILDDWQNPLCYKEQGEWVIGSPNMNEEFLSLSLCLVPCELVGLDCIEQYVPHRVGMQFGMDQDIPGPIPRANENWEIAWRTYDKPIRNISFYIPPRLFKSDVTAQYFDWWNQSSSIKHDEIKRMSIHPISSSSIRVSSESESSISPPPGFARRRRSKDQSSNDEDEMTILEWYKCQRDHVQVNDMSSCFSKYFAGAQVQSSSSTTKEKANGNKQVMKTDNNLYNKDPMNIFEEDTDGRSEDSAGICSDTYHHGVTNTDEFELPELEARVDKLEIVVNCLKEKRRLVLEVHFKQRDGT